MLKIMILVMGSMLAQLGFVMNADAQGTDADVAQAEAVACLNALVGTYDMAYWYLDEGGGRVQGTGQWLATELIQGEVVQCIYDWSETVEGVAQTGRIVIMVSYIPGIGMYFTEYHSSEGGPYTSVMVPEDASVRSFGLYDEQYGEPEEAELYHFAITDTGLHWWTLERGEADAPQRVFEAVGTRR